jgi:hypothetical protein
MKKLFYSFALAAFSYLLHAQCSPPTTGNSPYCNGFAVRMGGNSHVSAGDAGYAGITAITFQAWIYPTAYPGNGRFASILSKGASNSNTQGFSLCLKNVGGTVFLSGTVSNGTTLASGEISNAATFFPLNHWTHVTIRWTTGQPVEIFTDGAFRNGSAPLTGTMNNNTQPLRIGSSNDALEDGFTGVIDEVAIFKGAWLANSTILFNYKFVIGPGHPNFNNLFNYYRFSESGGTTTRDQGCQGNNGTLIGSNIAFEGSHMPCETFNFGTPTITATDNLFDKIDVTITQNPWLPATIPTAQAHWQTTVVKNGSIPFFNTGFVSTFTKPDTSTCLATYSITQQAWISTLISSAFNNTVYTDTGRINTFNFSASNGTFPTKTVLTWSSIPSVATNGFAIYRDQQQIATISSPNATIYNDFDGIPGVRYVYTVQPISNSGPLKMCATDTGWIKENGRLSGYVRSPLNAPVPNVIVTATANVLGQTYTYTDTTDASGFFEIRDVYYHLQATYTLTPSKGTHGFSPASLQRTLDVLAFNAPQANFIDTSVFTVSGKVYFPNQTGGAGCGHQSVKILVNNQDVGVQTNANGEFTYTAQQEGNYSFKPIFKHHTFVPAIQTFFIEDNKTGVNFLNTTKDTLLLSLFGYCQKQITDSAKFIILSIGTPGGCYTQTVWVKGFEEKEISLPAQQYLVELSEVKSANPNEDSKILTLVPKYQLHDLTQRDTLQQSVVTASEPLITGGDTITLPNGQVVVTPYDTLIVYDTVLQTTISEHLAEYLYGGTLSISYTAFQPDACGRYVLAQGNTYNAKIEVFRLYSYNGYVDSCRLDYGILTMYDDVSDSGFVTYTIDSGIVRYNINPGQPNIIGSGPKPYQKFIQFFAKRNGAIDGNRSQWFVVTGNRALTPTFVTKTPELPFFVLHDPPGDGSSATITQGTSLSYGYETGVEEAVGTNSFVNVQLGTEVPVPFTGIVFSAGASLNISVATNKTNTSNKSVNTTFTMLNNFSTSSDKEFIGEDADVVVGASLNMIYGLSFIVDTLGCTVKLDTALTWGANDFATTYMYTIGHIKNTLIPQLDFLINFYNNIGSDSALIYQNYKNVWQQVVNQNRQNINNAEFKENRSFSGGVTYTNTTTYENTNAFSITYQTTINPVIAAAINIGTEQNNVEVGTEVNMSWTTTKNTSNTATTSKEVSYTFNDKNAGDFFSVDVKRDKVYGTPAFKVVAGTSSCPHEQGTQQRDLPKITVLNPFQQNVPITSAATFSVQMTNLSESQETRTYNVIVDPASNLDGAIIRLGGQLISQSPATFTIPANGSIYATMSVEKGPIAVDYTNLKLIIYSPCDDNVYDEAIFQVGFQSNCSNISLFTPSNNWLVNKQDSTLTVTYGGFNANDTSLVEIGLQIRRPGQAWSTIPASRVSKVQLQNNNFPYYSVVLNMGGYADGAYEIRAYADCNAQPPIRSYSTVLSGVIDRTLLTLFGTPSPADGVLNMNEEVSVTFTENLDCSHFFNFQTLMPYSVKLTRADNGDAVPFTFQCVGNKILYTIQQTTLNALQGVLLTASVSGYYDVNGNIMSQPVVWSFVVNNSPVFWQPSGVSASVLSGGTSTCTATLRNLTTASQNFTLSSLPNWLSPVGVPGSIAPGASLNINFNVSGILNPGVYKDTVWANVAALGLQLPLFVELTVYAPSPNWTVVTKPAQMNIIANFSLTSANAPLSSDVNDRIAVFVGAECRGVANIQYTAAGNAYAAYITAYGNPNAQPPEVFEFRMWDASAAREYQAIETQAFVENALIGKPIAPLILHPAGVVQRIPLNTGWNWVSTYLQPNNPNVNDVMKYTAKTSGTIVKTNDSYAQFSPSQSIWSGTLNQIGWQKSYQIFVNAPTELQVVGQPMSNTNFIPVVSGWNWIGYPQSVIDSASKFLKNYAATTGDVLQSDNQFSTFSSGAWNGSLQLMQPGRGYKLKAFNGGTIPVQPRAAPNWNPDVFGNEFNMNITAVVKAAGVEALGNFIVGAFINGTCVGVSSPQLAGSLSRVFLTLHGQASNNGQSISFLIYDFNTDSIYIPTFTPVTFQTDGVVGNIETAFELIVESPLAVEDVKKGQFVLHQNIPNPFNGKTIIRYAMPVEEKVVIEVYDFTGRVVAQPVNATMPAGEHQLEFNQEALTSGVYFYRMMTGGFTQTRKMVIKN